MKDLYLADGMDGSANLVEGMKRGKEKGNEETRPLHFAFNQNLFYIVHFCLTVKNKSRVLSLVYNALIVILQLVFSLKICYRKKRGSLSHFNDNACWSDSFLKSMKISLAWWYMHSFVEYIVWFSAMKENFSYEACRTSHHDFISMSIITKMVTSIRSSTIRYLAMAANKK